MVGLIGHETGLQNKHTRPFWISVATVWFSMLGLERYVWTGTGCAVDRVRLLCARVKAAVTSRLACVWLWGGRIDGWSLGQITYTQTHTIFSYGGLHHITVIILSFGWFLAQCTVWQIALMEKHGNQRFYGFQIRLLWFWASMQPEHIHFELLWITTEHRYSELPWKMSVNFIRIFFFLSK